MFPPALVLKVALPLPLPWLFDYAPPPGVDAAGVVPGQRVRVPLGTRELTGIVDSVGAAEPLSNWRRDGLIEFICRTPGGSLGERRT